MRDRELYIKLRVGMFVLVLLILFVVFVLTIGVQTRLFEERYPLQAAFRDVQGLVVGAPVRLAGLTVGTVQQITFGPDVADPRIHVEVTIDQEFQSRIREDSVASIGTIGLVGDKVFEITVGSESANILDAGDILQTTEPVDFARIVALGGEVLEVGREMIRDLAVVARNLRTLSERAEKGEGLLGALMAKKDVPLVDNLNRSAAHLEHTLKEIREGNGLLHALIFEKGGADVVEDLRQTAAGLEEVVGRLQAGGGILGALLTEQRSGQVVQDLGGIVADLKRITRALAEGEGTLGALIQDPTVYEDLSSLLRGAERSWILRGLIRSSVRGGQDTVEGREK
jgi:phospholipid/cholesterol/gamma-HCH transport system substrate-binding protein